MRVSDYYVRMLAHRELWIRERGYVHGATNGRRLERDVHRRTIDLHHEAATGWWGLGADVHVAILCLQGRSASLESLMASGDAA